VEMIQRTLEHFEIDKTVTSCPIRSIDQKESHPKRKRSSFPTSEAFPHTAKSPLSRPLRPSGRPNPQRQGINRQVPPSPRAPGPGILISAPGSFGWCPPRVHAARPPTSTSSIKMAARPTVSVYTDAGEASGSVALPKVFTAPIRLDVVQQVHSE
jgi:hypothetical protein